MSHCIFNIRTSCASTGRRLLIWMPLTALRVTVTMSARIRCMLRAFTDSAWKVCSSKRSSSDVKSRPRVLMEKLSDGLAVLAVDTGCGGYSRITLSHCPYFLKEQFCQEIIVLASFVCSSVQRTLFFSPLTQRERARISYIACSHNVARNTR